jgi:Rrf2 family nitric oxide-sensitive transcriptional repressor
MVLVHRLGGLGFLENTRGRGGGIKLARPASRIRLGDIVQAIEPHFQLVECFKPGSNSCLISAPCRLRDILEEALAAWLSVLNEYTLLDLVKDNAVLVQLLNVPPEALRL